MDRKTYKKQAYKVSLISILSNIFLFVFKLVAGLLTFSVALISDAVHTASDVFTSIIVIVGIKISSKESDENHEYGHERFECIAAILLAVMLFATGVGILYVAIEKMIKGNYEVLTLGWLALTAAIVSIIVKEVMFQLTIRVSKKLNSGALKADAWHHRSDALSSVGSLIGVIGSLLGVPVLDSVASLIICVFILKAAFDIFKDAVSKLTDEACDKQIETEIFNEILNTDGVINIDNLKTRKFGDRVFVQVDILADSALSLPESHNIAEKVESNVKTKFSFVKDCFVHINPTDKKNKVE